MKFTGERMIPEFNEGQELYLEHIARYSFASQFCQDKVVLDIACGSGYGSDLLVDSKAKKVFGVDISRETINYCRNHYNNKNIQFIEGGVDNIPISDKSIDLVVSFETLEHVNERIQKKFLNETDRILKKEGIFIVSTPNTRMFSEKNPFHKKELKPDEFEFLLKKYFKYVFLFYQDNVLSNFVLSSNQLGKKHNKISEEIRVSNTIIIEPQSSIYIIAVCSNSKMTSMSTMGGIVSLSNLKPANRYKHYEEDLKNKNSEIKEIREFIETQGALIRDIDKKIKQKDQEILSIKSSRFWKMREFFARIKRSSR